jgi:predicted nucleic acid-binding protein
MDTTTTHGNKFVLDTCAIINILENRSVADLIKCHIDTENSRVYLNSVSLDEASRKGYDKKRVVSKISEYLDTLVIVKDVTDENHTTAQRLEDDCALIHHGDSAIAAFSVDNKSTLVTYDKGLLKGCHIVGIPTFNPNMMLGGVVA